MINANEARELVSTSVEAHEMRIVRIGEQITSAAQSGKRSISLTNTLPYFTELHAVWTSSYRTPEMTAIQRLVAVTLRKLGFEVTIETEKTKTRNDDFEEVDGDDESFIKVSW
jgi:hypothetical protein